MFLPKIIMLTFLFFVGCTNVTEKSSIQNAIMINKDFEKYYNIWDIENAKIVLDKMKYEENVNLNYELIKNNLLKRELKKEELLKIVVNIKYAVEENNLQNIGIYLENTVSNRLKLKELEKYDFTGIKVYYNEIEFYYENAEVITAFVYFDEIRYYLVKFSLNNNSWSIVDFLEKGES